MYIVKKTRNQFEKRIYSQLKRSKVKFKYEAEKISYLLARHYIPDFIITLPNGDKRYIECKGYLRADDKAKLRAVKKLHPAMDLRILFYSERKAYIKWATKYGFPYAIEKVPKEWLTI